MSGFSRPGRASRIRVKRVLSSALVAAGLLLPAAPALSEPPAAEFRSRSINWAAAPASPIAKRGGRVVLVVSGRPAEGWHVYGFRQQPRGPISLNVALEPTPLASADGQPGGSPPVKVFEPAFGVETPYYERPFTVSIPVRIKAGAPAGQQLIPVSIRFQTCSGATCEPPKTIRLSAPVQVAG